MEEILILVDKNDKPLGSGFKIPIHQQGLLHRAFSIFIFNNQGELMLQQRAAKKYHSGKLWTNSCCGHPRWGENTDDAAHRRLGEEMGMDCKLYPVSTLVYRAQVSNNLIEHEYDHIYVGLFNDSPKINFNEANDWKWQDTVQLEKELKNSPEQFTIWFREIINKRTMREVESWKPG